MDLKSLLWAAGILLCLGSSLPKTGWAAGDRDTAVALLTGVEKLAKGGQPEKALELCGRAEAADPACAEVFLAKGSCLEALRRPREAIESYTQAERLATNEKDSALAQKAKVAAEKVCPSLARLTEADRKLIAKLQPLGADALASEQFETAQELYTLLLALAPDHPQAKESLALARSGLEKRGDPVRARVAEAMLAEIWYLTGIGKKEEARKMAQTLSNSHKDTAAGREAGELLARDFKAPNATEVADLKGQLLAAAGKAKAKPAEGTPGPAPAGGPGAGAKPVAGGSTKGEAPPGAPVGASPGTRPTAQIDLALLDQSAGAAAKRLTKDQLVPAFREAFKKGMEAYTRAAPGVEGNQESLAQALEQFLLCEALGTRLEAEHLLSGELAQSAQQASMLRYGCMKMVVLLH